MHEAGIPSVQTFTAGSELIMFLHLDGHLLDRVAELINLLDLPRDLATTCLLDWVQLRLVHVGWELRVDGRRGLDGRVRRRGLRHAQRATKDTVDKREEATK